MKIAFEEKGMLKDAKSFRFLFIRIICDILVVLPLLVVKYPLGVKEFVVMDKVIYWFSYLMSPEASSFWAMMQFLVVVISLFFIYRQIKLHRYSNMLNMISAIDGRWNSEDFLKHRQDICKKYKTGNSLIKREEGEVLGFFEDIGIYSRKKVFDSDIIWDKYSYFIEHYWQMYEPHIKEYRASHNDETWYEQFQYLYEEMKKISIKRNVNAVGKTQAQIKKFIQGEIGEST